MLDRIYQSLGGKKLSENSCLLHCPAHDDSNPSLSVTRAGSNLLMFCHTGCSYEEICNALKSKGINMRYQNLRDGRNDLINQKKIKKTVRRVRVTNINKKANDIYFQSRIAMKHPYFEHKGIRAHDVRIREGCLLIPMRDGQGRLQGIQYIGEPKHNGQPNSKTPKWFLKGTKPNGLSYCIGTKADTIYICEGYADAISIYESTGRMSVAAFSCNNLVEVAKSYRKKYPQAQFKIAGDADAVGIKCAKKAATAIDGLLALPCEDFAAGGIKDFNDLYRIEGKKSVRKKLDDARHVSEAGETGIVAVHISDFMKMEFPAREMILEPWLQTQSLSMIHSYRGVGKTLLILGIINAVTTGKSILRWTAPKRRGVLLVDGEMPGIELQERWGKMVSSSRDLNTLPLTIITQDLQSHPLPDLATEEGQLAIEQFITDDTELIILDNLSTLLRSGTENEAESWRSFQGWLLKLRSMGKSVLLIHHSGKKGFQRGTSKREDTLDTVLKLERPDDYSGVQGARFNIYIEKGRALYGKNAVPFEAWLYENNHESYRWIDKDIAPKKDDTKMMELLEEGKTLTEIGSIMGVHQTTIGRRKKRAEKNKNAPHG